MSTITREIYNHVTDEYEDVKLNGSPEWEDPSFDYAGTHCTGGKSGTHKLPSYPSMANSSIEWNRELYDETMNRIIALYIEDNKESIEDGLCESFEDEQNQY